jgi:hypothetical protein
VPALFDLSDDYNPNAAPEILICLNKVGKDSGRYTCLIRTGISNVQFYIICD